LIHIRIKKDKNVGNTTKLKLGFTFRVQVVLTTTNLIMEPSEAAVKATDSVWKQQSRSAACEGAGASNLSRELSTSYNRSFCTIKSHKNK
jgi:hypothetical protein